MLKPCATGCVRRREGLVSEDAEFLAHCAAGEIPPRPHLSPVLRRTAAPAVAAERAHKPLDWEAINRSISLMSDDSDVMIVEGVGGIMVPMDAKHSFSMSRDGCKSQQL